jgi:ubiquinone/menaquinone biosynthesis C-methylase UbiE
MTWRIAANLTCFKSIDPRAPHSGQDVKQTSYQASDVHRRYDRGRKLAPDATRDLMLAFRRHVPEKIRLIVDLGSGTGRFTEDLAATFAASVVGVEPAPNMRAMAEAKAHSAAVRFVDGTVDRIPLQSGSADLVFMSQVLHHVEDRPACFREIRRVLSPEGRLGVRQTTRENLDSYFYQRFFPEARALDEQRLPYREALLGLATQSGFRLIALETLRHEIADTASDYVEKIALRTYSDLEYIPDAAFRGGLTAFRNYSFAHPDLPRFAENDLHVFRMTPR